MNVGGGDSTSSISVLLLILILLAREGAVNDAVGQRSGSHSCVMAKGGKHKERTVHKWYNKQPDNKVVLIYREGVEKLS